MNLSVGYDFDPEWFACGQSPLCVEVDRLVRSGVVVVVAAGNTGYGYANTAIAQASAAAPLTINDPGNAELAITVGSTHRDMPHIYGVSYFSSKGPTGDGRLKPDSSRPGEKIISCAPRKRRRDGRAAAAAARRDATYIEDSGTSMAAPHVSGVVAAFLSIRREFIGQPEEVKQIFLPTRHRPAARALLPGRRPRRPDARHSIRLNQPSQPSRPKEARVATYPFQTVEVPFDASGALAAFASVSADGKRDALLQSCRSSTT